MIEPTDGTLRRVRRPKDKEDLIERLRVKSGGAFADIRDVILFAATVGFSERRFEPFDATSEPIRWDTFINRWFSEDLVRLIAVAHSDEKEVAASDRIMDQLAIFEGYANGGLSVLAERMARTSDAETLEAIIGMFDVAAGERKGVDALITLVETPDFT